MIRQDFISKIIEQLFTAIAKLMKINHEKESELFLVTFQELLQTYFQLNSEQLEELIKADRSRDPILLDEKLKSSQLLMFTHAGLAYAKNGDLQKAQQCLSIVDRIQVQNSTIFEFPNSDSVKLLAEIEELKKLMV